MAKTFVPDPGGLDAAQINYLRTAKRRIKDNYSLGAAQNKYQQSGLRNQYARGKADLKREFARARMQVPSGFAKAGTLNSGLYQNAIKRFGDERTAAFGNLQGQFKDELQGLELGYKQLGQVRDSGYNDVAEEEAARRYALATSLRGV